MRAVAIDAVGRDVSAGAALARARLRCRPFALVCLLCLMLAAAAGIIERAVAPAGAADRTIIAITRLVLPLTCFAITRIGLGPNSLRDATWPAARYGARRRHVALGSVSMIALASMLLAIASSTLGLLFAYRGASSDLVTTGWIVALSAGSYTALLAFATSFGRNGGGRWFALIGDLALGSGAGGFAVVWPRSHTRNLIGDGSVLALTQAQSSALMLGMFTLLLALCFARSGD